MRALEAIRYRNYSALPFSLRLLLISFRCANASLSLTLFTLYLFRNRGQRPLALVVERLFSRGDLLLNGISDII